MVTTEDTACKLSVTKELAKCAKCTRNHTMMLWSTCCLLLLLLCFMNSVPPLHLRRWALAGLSVGENGHGPTSRFVFNAAAFTQVWGHGNTARQARGYKKKFSISSNTEIVGETSPYAHPFGYKWPVSDTGSHYSSATYIPLVVTTTRILYLHRIGCPWSNGA